VTLRYKVQDGVNEKVVERLHKVSEEVAKRIDPTDIFLKWLPDTRFDTVPIRELSKIVEDLVTLLKPKVIYTRNADDLNVDHSVLNWEVLTATGQVPGCHVKQIYAFEIPSSTE
jgi:hypothetical protein